MAMPAKGIFRLFAVFLVLGVFLLPNVALAVNHEYVGCVRDKLDDKDNCDDEDQRKVCYEGIVPCGKGVKVAANADENDSVYWDKGNKTCAGGAPLVVNCQFCHFFIMIDGIVDFLLVDIIPAVTVGVLVIGGIMYYFSGFKPGLRGTSIKLFKGVLIGLALIYGAYMLIGIVLMVLGAAEMNPLKSIFDSSNGIFSIKCPIEVP